MPSKKRTAPAAPSVHGPVYVTRQVHFNAGHRLYNPARSRAWNERQYGVCANHHGHGHNYVLEATVAGEPDAATGYVIDLAELKQILYRAIVLPCDHRSLNDDVPFLAGVNPTTENLTVAFWGQIEPHIRPGRLHSVRLYETPRNFAEYFGPSDHRPFLSR